MMDREQFLQQLRALLADTAPEEREEAIRYYEEYFDEAGPEQEQAILAELGSPAKVAAIIRANVPGSRPAYTKPAAPAPAPDAPASNAPDGSGRPGVSPSAAAEGLAAGARSIRSRIRGLAEFDSAPHAPEPPRMPTDEPAPEPAPEPAGPYSYAAEGSRYAARGAGSKNTLLFILLLILFSPVWMGLLGALLGLLFGAIGAFAGLIGGGVGAACAGIFGLVRALPLLITSPANGIIALAASLFGIGLGLLLFGVGVWCMGTLIPLAVRGAKKLCRRLFGRGGEA